MNEEKVMVDDYVPTNQFHPYIRPEIPEIKPESKTVWAMRRIGLDGATIEPIESVLTRFRSGLRPEAVSGFFRRNGKAMAIGAVALLGGFLLVRKLRA